MGGAGAFAVLLGIFLSTHGAAALKGPHCVSYGECNVDSNGRRQPCVANIMPVPLTDPEGLEILKRRCPHLAQGEEPLTCCNAGQLRTLDDQLKKAEAIYGRCPTCIRNIMTFSCDVACHTGQSEFLEVEKTMTSDTGKYITEYNVYFSEETQQAVYDSCKGVIMPQSGKYVTDIACGVYDSSTCNPARWFAYTGDTGNPVTPFQMNFFSTTGLFEDMTFDNFKTLRCNESFSDTEGACSCVDCALSCPAADSSYVKKSSGIQDFVILGANGVLVVTVIVFILAVLLAALLVYRGVCGGREEGDKEMLHDPSPDGSLDEGDATGTPSFLEKLGDRTEIFLTKVFRAIGTGCAKRPTIVLFAASWLLAGLVYCVTMINVVTDPVELWASPVSSSRQEKDYLDSHFTPFYRTEQMFIKAVGLPQINHTTVAGEITFGPVFNKEFLLAVYDLQKRITNLGQEDGEGLEKVCYAPLSSEFLGPVKLSQCTIQSPWGYFQDSLEAFNETSTQNGRETNYLDKMYKCIKNAYDPTCLAPYGGPAEGQLVLGGFLKKGQRYGDVDVNMVSADTLILTFVVSNHVEAADNKAAEKWEARMVDFILEYIEKEKPAFMDIAFRTERSLQDEISKVSAAVTGTVLLSYFVMFVYISIALGRFTTWRRILVDSRITLSLGGVIIVLLSVLSSIGFFGILEVPTTMLTLEVIPFLVLAVGVDNIFIMVRRHDQLKREHGARFHVSERIGETLGEVGPSMLLSTLAEGACFLIGALSTMPAVKTFALYAVVALTINFLLQITAFVALLALDEKRALENRLDFLCCVRSSVSPPEDKGKPTILQRMFENGLAPLLAHRWGRISVPLIFLAWLLCSLQSFPQLEIGLEEELAMADDSYMLKYFQVMKDKFAMGPPVYFLLTPGLNFSSREHQNVICGGQGCADDSLATLIHSAARMSDKTYIARPASSWLDDLFDWTTVDGCCKVFKSNDSFCPHDRGDDECKACNIPVDTKSGRPTGESLRKYLPYFLQDSPDLNCAKGGHAAYASAVNYVTDRYQFSDVKDAFFMSYHTPLRTSEDYYEAMRSARNLGKEITDTINKNLKLKNPVRVFPYSIFYVFYEQYLTIVKDTGVALGMSLACLFGVTTLLNGFDIWASTIVSFIVSCIVVNLIGFMVWWHITLNAISLVNLVVAMGIAVEFCSHIVHAFQKSTLPNRAARAKDALVTMGSSVFAGITLTKFAGIVILAMAKSQIFQVFYFRMYLIMVIVGATHGLILLPVVLSFVGSRTNRARFQRIRQTRLEAELLGTAGRSG